MLVDAVVVAGGSSARFGGEDKLLADLCGRTVLACSLEAMVEARTVGRIVVVVADPTDAAYRAKVTMGSRGAFEWARGGARRRDSVAAGLAIATSRYVAIHDGARPLVTAKLVDRVVAAAEGNPGAIAAVAVADTIKVVREGTIVEHPDRRRLWAAQTPQVVLRQAWLDAAAAGDDDETDDAAMLARLGLECVVVEGDADNFKITRPNDLAIARALMAERGECR